MPESNEMVFSARITNGDSYTALDRKG